MRIRRASGVAAIAAGFLILTGVIGARAYHDASTTNYFGSSYANPCDTTPLSQCVANDAAHRYTRGSGLSDARWNATQRGFVVWGGNTDINVSTVSPWDVYVMQTNNPDVDAFAWGQCVPQGPYGGQFGGSDAAHTRWCSPSIIYWNTWSVAAGKVDSTAKENYIGCHESGHTVGLRHRSAAPSTCMVGASRPSDPNSVVPSVQNPTSDDYSRINLHY